MPELTNEAISLIERHVGLAQEKRQQAEAVRYWRAVLAFGLGNIALLGGAYWKSVDVSAQAASNAALERIREVNTDFQGWRAYLLNEFQDLEDRSDKLRDDTGHSYESLIAWVDHTKSDLVSKAKTATQEITVTMDSWRSTLDGIPQTAMSPAQDDRLQEAMRSIDQLTRNESAQEDRLRALQARLDTVPDGVHLGDTQQQVSLPPEGAPITPPIGSVVALAGELVSLPPSWIPCDGRRLAIAEFPQLFEAIGAIYGGGDGSFAVPDYRGVFLRGLDRQGLRDPGGNGREIGSLQDDTLKAHNHDATSSPSGEHSHAVSVDGAISAQGGDTDEDPNGSRNQRLTGRTDTAGPHVHKIEVQAFGAEETRPKNMAVVWVIRAK